MTYLDNPAGRLYNVLDQLRDVAKTYQQNDRTRTTHVKMRSAMKGILGADDLHTDLLDRVGSVLGLPMEVRAQVSRLGAEGDDLVEHLREIENVLPQLAGNGLVHQVKIPDRAMVELNSCSATLHLYRREATVAPEQLDQLRQEITKLVADVLAGDLPDELQRFFLDRLRQMERALDLYEIQGVDGLSAVLEQTMGSLALMPKAKREQVVQTQSGRKFLKILGGFGVAVRVVRDAIEIARFFWPDLSALESADGGSNDDNILDGELVDDDEKDAA